MRSKKEVIIDNGAMASMGSDGFLVKETQLENMMEAYAKETLIDFIHWGNRHGHVVNFAATTPLNPRNSPVVHRTTDQLYEEYIKQKK
jgi:hypothetical protein